MIPMSIPCHSLDSGHDGDRCNILPLGSVASEPSGKTGKIGELTRVFKSAGPNAKPGPSTSRVRP